MDVEHHITEAAFALGFIRVGFCSLEPLTRDEAALGHWLRAHHHGDMAYMAKHPSRSNPGYLLPEAQSLIAVALPYPASAMVSNNDTDLRGRVASYALGTDYHDTLRLKLKQLAHQLDSIFGHPVLARPCVDSAPLLERAYAHRTGIGFIAKNTMTIIPGKGSYVWLGELIIDQTLKPSTQARTKCGDCTACITACPTDALVAPHQLDARRCIAYLTIELRGPIPHTLRSKMGTWVFGCDLCQEVCPFNAKLKRSCAHPIAQQQRATPLLEQLVTHRSSDHRRFVQGTAMRRVGRNQLARNAAVALGNTHDERALPILARCLEKHPSHLVRGHAAWALGHLMRCNIGAHLARKTLLHASSECDAFVQQEIQIALQEKSATTGT